MVFTKGSGRPPKRKRTPYFPNRTAGSNGENLKRSATRRAQKLSQEQEWEGTSIYDTAKQDRRPRTGKSVARKRCRRALGTTQETASQLQRIGSKRKRKRTATRGRGSGRTTQDTPTKDKDTPTPKDNLDYFTTRLGLELCNDANELECATFFAMALAGDDLAYAKEAFSLIDEDEDGKLTGE